MEINENNIQIVIKNAKKWEEEVYNNLELEEKPEMEEKKWEWEEEEEKESEKERNFEIEVEDIDSLKEFLGEIGCHVNKDEEKAVLIQIYSFLSVSASESFPESKISLMECFIHGHVKHYCATVKPEMFSSLECEKEEIEDSSSSEDQMFFDICKEVLAREDDSDGAGEESSLSQKAESNTTTEMHLIDNIFGSSSPKWKTLGESATEDNAFAKDLLNVPLDQYEELKVICGDDQATGCYAKSNCDVEDTCDSREASDAPSTTSSSIQGSGRQKRSRHWGEEALSKIDGLTRQVSLLAEAVSTVDQEFCDRVYGEVMKLEGFDDRVLDKAFEYLTNHPVAGRQFLSKRHNMRMMWMEDFAAKKD